MSIKIDGSGVMTFNDNSVQSTAFDTRFTKRRNMIMNALYAVNQRASSAVNQTGYLADRWKFESPVTVTSGEMVTNASLSPSLYQAYYTRLRANAAQATITSGNYAMLKQSIEGTLTSQLMWGTANAKPATVSFRASANVAGTMSVAVRGANDSRSYVTTVALTTTPQRYVITVPGDTTGSYDTGTGWGLNLCFLMYCGTQYSTSSKDVWQAGNFIAHTSQTNFNATLSNEIRISDVQMEIGTVASDLEYVEYQDELLRCKRYYNQVLCSARFYATSAGQYSSNGVNWMDMRVKPTPTQTNVQSINYTSQYYLTAQESYGGRFEVYSNGAGDCYALNVYFKLEADQ